MALGNHCWLCTKSHKWRETHTVLVKTAVGTTLERTACKKCYEQHYKTDCSDTNEAEKYEEQKMLRSNREVINNVTN